MKKSLLQFSICILMGVTLLLAGSATVGKAADLEAFRAAVQDIFDTYSTAMNAEDSDLYISLWDENGINMGPNAPAVVGIEEVQVAGDWGYARGTYSLSVTPKAGGETAFDNGKWLKIFKRQPDGSWKIFRNCFNSDVPPG